MNFDFNKFTDELYEKYKDVLDRSEIQELLNLNDEYGKDTPISTGKRLIVKNITLLGEKEVSENQDYSGAKINFSLPLETGVNIIIADNLKGKSSVFKVIKYALTGANSLKDNIKKWIHHAFVNFSINEKKYTVYLDLSKYRLYAGLFNSSFNSLEELEKNLEDVLFSANSETTYQDLINDFFFQQFTYYSLKWTQKSSQKDKDELLEAGASWKTYFKSILLESKDSTSLMYGDQGKKVFQMLLGLKLTYPINRLTIKKDLLNYEKAKEQSFSERQKKQRQNNLGKFKSRITEIDIELNQIQKTSIEQVNLAPHYNEYNTLLGLIQSENKKFIEFEKVKQAESNELNSIKAKQQANQFEIIRLRKELEKSKKQSNDLKEFVEIGILFSNLDIKHCPSCNHDVSITQKQARLQEHKCSLCNESIENTDDVEIDVYKEKIENLEIAIINLEKEISSLTKLTEVIQEKFNSVYSELVSSEQMLNNIQDVSSLSNRLQEIEDIINSEKSKVNPSDSRKEELVSEKAVINFQLNEILSQETIQVSNYETKIKLLDSAITKLSEHRFELGTKVLDRLSELMKNEIRDFGLTSITEVLIKDNFELYYKQDNDYVTFENIAEGEQLRAKIAFYLSLIQLDIEFNFGRHTRLLIIDSPGKEEADSKYLDGLALVLKSIESRYGDKLQILIGTAERKLAGIVKNQKEFAVDEYVF
ncbi:MAG: hypothetical protein FD155_3284 [Bacteroidetes bacterium]|nr:MAG: hypothetical protein FD155_3284 [Bacteroidota bacterium]